MGSAIAPPPGRRCNNPQQHAAKRRAARKGAATNGVSNGDGKAEKSNGAESKSNGKGKAKGKEKKEIIISHEASRKQFLVKVPPGGPSRTAKSRAFPYKKRSMKAAKADAEAYFEQSTKQK